MTLKLTILGLCIYAALAVYLAAWGFDLARRNKTAARLFLLGFALNALALVLRWNQVRHLPMQSMFEIFLWLAALIYPISVLCRRCLRIHGRAMDLAIAVILLFPAAFIFDAESGRLPPALQSWMFGPHVGAYMLSYVLLLKAAASAVKYLWTHQIRRRPDLTLETDGYKLACLGFPLLTLGLVLGCFWAKIAWGQFWSWDPKELWSLASWLAFAGYFHQRRFRMQTRPSLNAALLIFGAVLIIMTLVWVNLSRIFAGLHNYA